MPVVRVKGVQNAMQFPDNMEINDIRSFLQRRFANQAVAGNQPMDLAPLQGQARASEQSLAQKAGQSISNALVDSGIISDRFGAQQIGKNVTSIGEFLPGIGDATAGDEFGRALKQGDNFGMGVGLLSAIPLLGSLAKPAAEGASTALKSLIDSSKETSSEVISSRLGRAQSQGFNVDNVVFHGTPADFKEFDPKLAGAKSDDFGEAIYFSDDPDIASGFSVSLTKNKEFQDVIDEAEKAKSEMSEIVRSTGVKSQEFKAIRSKMTEINSRRSVLYDSINEFKLPTTGSNVRPAILKGNLAKFDAKGKHYSQVNEEAVALAKSQGSDGVVISNSVDAGSTKSSKPSTISIVFKPNNIRSIFDEFKAPSTDKAMSVGGMPMNQVKPVTSYNDMFDFTPEQMAQQLRSSNPSNVVNGVYIEPTKFGEKRFNPDGSIEIVKDGSVLRRIEPQESGMAYKNKIMKNESEKPEVKAAQDKRKADMDAERARQKAQESDSYKMQHTAPRREDNSSGDNLTNTFGEDIYSGKAKQYFGTGSTYDEKAISIIQSMRDNPEKQVTIYRAVPKSVKSINATDWVTTTREYAQEHLEGEKGWHILSKKVKAKDIATDGNSIHEFGYDPSN
jgi:hypothetical protein